MASVLPSSDRLRAALRLAVALGVGVVLLFSPLSASAQSEAAPEPAVEARPPAPLDGRALDHLEAVARLHGLVRFFHPSDQVEAEDWDAAALAAVEAVEEAGDAAELATILRDLYRPVAPTLQVEVTGSEAAVEAERAAADAVAGALEAAFGAGTDGDGDGTRPGEPGEADGDGEAGSEVVAWMHFGVGLSERSLYRSQRAVLPDPSSLDAADLASPTTDDGRDHRSVQALQLARLATRAGAGEAVHRVDLPGGVTAWVPLVVGRAIDGPTRPAPSDDARPASARRPERFADEGFSPGGLDRTVRLASVIQAWTVLQHFYPYFDVVPADWPSALRRALAEAAVAPDLVAWDETLDRLIDELHDGHGNAWNRETPGFRMLPVAFLWLQGRLVVSAVAEEAPEGLRPGDVVLAVDDEPVEVRLARARARISSSTPQWELWRAAQRFSGTRSDAVELLVASPRPPGEAPPAFDEPRRVRVPALEGLEGLPAVERPEPIAEVAPGIWYVDVGEVEDATLAEAIEDLAAADGVVFDLRGYPAAGILALRHLAGRHDGPVTSARWNVPVIVEPDRRGLELALANWPVVPAEPTLEGPVVFLTDGRAISYAETWMGIVEHYRLADIVGSPTAGTNGNVNPFELPDGSMVVWTGMDVRKHDGSLHHGVGIHPTVPVEPTPAGLAAGRDEVLEAGIEVIRDRLREATATNWDG